MTKPLSRTSKAAWQKHIDAQVTSGLSQSDYCRAHQLGIKYFSFWKSKLRKTTKPAVSVNDNSIALIPVVVKNESNNKVKLSEPITSTPTTSLNHSIYIDMKLTFSNGVAMELRLLNETILLPFITQLIQLPC